jgi:putative transposase
MTGMSLTRWVRLRLRAAMWLLAPMTMTRAELGKWFTIYVAKVYANKFHHGINTTPLAKYKEGIVGTANRPRIGFPERIIEPAALALDFMPFEERTIQGYGV